MNHAHHQRLWVAAAIIAAIIIAGFLFSVPHTRDIATTPASPGPTTPSVALRDVFRKGIHTITGSVEAPNACATVAAQANLEGDTPETRRIVVAVSLEEGKGVCLELPTRVNFSTTLAAPAQIPLTATVNDVAASTTAP